MRTISHVFAAAGLATVIFTSIADDGRAADNLTILTEDYPPLNYVDQKIVTGPAVELVRQIRKRLNIDEKIQVYPWARGYKLLETQPGTVLFSVTRTELREKLFKWVGPLAEKKIGLFARKDSSIVVNTLEEAKKYLIGVQREGVGMQHLRAEGFTKFDAATKPEANLKKLLNGRNDLWYSSNATAFGNCRKLKLKSCDVKPVIVLKNTFMYIAFNKGTPDIVIQSWQKAYDDLFDEGVVKRIYKDYGMEALYPTR